MKRLLSEVNLETGELITLEGERFLVYPGDLPTCCTWTPTAELEINLGKRYIKNMECDETIKIL